jgi:molecular chaperone GrpE
MKDDNSVDGSTAAAMSEDEVSVAPVVEIDAEEPIEPGGEDPVQAELARLQQEAGNLRELYLRKLADFDNFRKRKDKEMADFRRQAHSEIVRDLLPVVDNLERALAVGAEDTGGVRAGVELTLRQFKDVLTRHGVVEVDPMGEVFDPAQHEAVSRLHTDSAEPNTIVQVLQKGYRLGDRLLRAALVVVAAPVGPPPAAPETEGDR